MVRHAFLISHMYRVCKFYGKFEIDKSSNPKKRFKSWSFFVPFSPEGFLSLDIKVTEGSDVNLPCYFPLSHEVTANALWFKEESLGEKTKLSSEDDWTHDKKVDLLYPLDSEQTIMLRHATAEDAGVYICESPEGQKLSSLNVIVEGSNMLHKLLLHGQ